MEQLEVTGLQRRHYPKCADDLIPLRLNLENPPQASKCEFLPLEVFQQINGERNAIC